LGWEGLCAETGHELNWQNRDAWRDGFVSVLLFPDCQLDCWQHGGSLCLSSSSSSSDGGNGVRLCVSGIVPNIVSRHHGACTAAAVDFCVWT
jgi:hypothetical protein